MRGNLVKDIQGRERKKRNRTKARKGEEIWKKIYKEGKERKGIEQKQKSKRS